MEKAGWQRDVTLRAALPGLVGIGLIAAWWQLADRLLSRPVRPRVGDPGQFVVVDGVRTYYRVQGHGPPLVLVHGLTMSHLTWLACAELLGRYFTVYTLDLPGFGYTDKPAGWASARHAGAFVAHFMSTLHLDRVSVVGHSMGGAAALWLAAEQPERVERLVVINAAGIGKSATIFRVLATPIVGDLLLKTTSRFSLQLLMRNVYVRKGLVTSDLAATYARFMWSPGARQALIQHSRAYAADRAALRPRLGNLHTPTLVVWTDRDPYFSLEVAHDLVTTLPSAHLEVVAGAGHLPHEEQPARVAQLIGDWFTTQPAAAYERAAVSSSPHSTA